MSTASPIFSLGDVPAPVPVFDGMEVVQAVEAALNPTGFGPSMRKGAGMEYFRDTSSERIAWLESAYQKLEDVNFHFRSHTQAVEIVSTLASIINSDPSGKVRAEAFKVMEAAISKEQEADYAGDPPIFWRNLSVTLREPKAPSIEAVRQEIFNKPAVQKDEDGKVKLSEFVDAFSARGELELRESVVAVLTRINSPTPLLKTGRVVIEEKPDVKG